jgi:hypothetical protein
VERLLLLLLLLQRLRWQPIDFGDLASMLTSQTFVSRALCQSKPSQRINWQQV